MERDNPMSDNELGMLLKQGKEEAYKEAVERFIRPVYSMCLKCLRNQEDAQDAAQDVFIRMFRSISTFDPNRSLSSWLFRITYNRCMDYLKKRGRSIEIPLEDIDAAAANGADPFSEEEISQETMRELVWASIDDIHEVHSFILLCKYRFRMKNAEIAETLDISENNLRVKLFRAKRELRLVVRKKLQEDS